MAGQNFIVFKELQGRVQAPNGSDRGPGRLQAFLASLLDAGEPADGRLEFEEKGAAAFDSKQVWAAGNDPQRLEYRCLDRRPPAAIGDVAQERIIGEPVLGVEHDRFLEELLGTFHSLIRFGGGFTSVPRLGFSSTSARFCLWPGTGIGRFEAFNVPSGLRLNGRLSFSGTG